jgi:hypothetical protein
MFLPSFQINSLARAMLFLINFKKIIGRAPSIKAANKKKKATHDQQRMIIAYCRTARATEAATAKPTRKATIKQSKTQTKIT